VVDGITFDGEPYVAEQDEYVWWRPVFGREEGSCAVPLVPSAPPPSLTVHDVTVTEGDSGTVNATFRVTMPLTAGLQAVDWATSDGTATAGSDYTAGNGTLTFTSYDTEKTFDVAVTGDTVNESNETFTVTLSNPVNATIGEATATGTITDDD